MQPKRKARSLPSAVDRSGLEARHADFERDRRELIVGHTDLLQEALPARIVAQVVPQPHQAPFAPAGAPSEAEHMPRVGGAKDAVGIDPPALLAEGGKARIEWLQLGGIQRAVLAPVQTRFEGA